LNNQKEGFFSQDFTELLINSVGGYISPERLELFLKKLEKELSKFRFDAGTEANLIRLFQSLFDKTTFVNESIKYPHRLEIIAAIAASSNFLTDIVVQNPGFLYQLFDNEYLSRIDSTETIKKEIDSGLVSFKSFNSKLNFLKQFKKRYILRLGINDLLGFNNLTVTTAQLSNLAAALLSTLFEMCIGEIEYKYSTSIPRTYCLASLGKQGGNELNYSSDVDLILFYEKDNPIEGTSGKEYFELLNESALLFIKSASEITERGYLYRVDFRLRPDGGHSPLCRTLADYMNYYESRGENWERQMLIKLNFIGGDIELFDVFFKYLRGFIFPSSFSSSIKEQVKKIKREIEKKISGAENVKLFRGGIRDIEFTVQALQLLNGGRFRDLRNGNTLESIELLKGHSLFTEQEADAFKVAYIFYRRTEHFLQLMNDRQTHLIPDDESMIEKLALYLNLKDKNEFKSVLEKHRKKVRHIYKHIMMSDPETPREYLEEINFKDKPRAVKNINFLENGAGLLGTKEFDSKTIEDFKTVEQDILKHLAACGEPDKLLENFTRVMKSTGFQSIWYSQFKGKYFLKNFLHICGNSRFSVDLLSSGRQAGDMYLSGECFHLPSKEQISEGNSKELLLNLSVLHSLGKIKDEKFSAIISEAIDARIKKYSEKFTGNYFIAAMGSYGSREMNYASDIDFLLVLDDKADIYKAELEYETLIKSVKNEIEFFEIDLRLRPEGKNSQLARTLSSYKKYFDDRARIWEFQSLTKLRFVCGNKNLFGKFKKMLIARIKEIDNQALKKEIIEMHNAFTKQSTILSTDMTDLKKSKGGLATIEFAVQYLLLSRPEAMKKCMGKTTAECIHKLEIHSVYQSDLNTLLQNYYRIKKLLLRNQNYSGTKNYKITADSEEGMLFKDLAKNNIYIFNKIMEI